MYYFLFLGVRIFGLCGFFRGREIYRVLLFDWKVNKKYSKINMVYFEVYVVYILKIKYVCWNLYVF